MLILPLLLVLALLGHSIHSVKNAVNQSKLCVDTSLGRTLGRKTGNVNEYLGIPFAEPPVGKLRFRPPVPKRPWYPNVHKAQSFAAECLQSALFVSDDGTIRDEDCLYLNIWQPNSINNFPMKQNPLLPVLVWIYGGAFIHGGTSKKDYQGRYLAQKGAIVVSFNYRLGALGFLVSTSDGLFGNYGLEDQKVALQWIHRNIEAFGGDPQRITIFGESAGAMSAGLHILDQTLRANNLSSKHQKPQPRAIRAVIMQSNPLGYK
jgi:para-nitrobenzyl esterase